MNESKNPSAVFSKKQIQAALFDLMEKTPYEKITVKEILYEAKIARKTFYRNFDSKDDNIGAVWNVIMCWLAGGMKTDKKLIKDVLVKYLSEMQPAKPEQ